MTLVYWGNEEKVNTLLAFITLSFALLGQPDTSLSIPGWGKLQPHTRGFVHDLSHTVVHGGNSSAHLKAESPTEKGHDWFGQEISADRYQGKRLRVSGYVKTQGVMGSAALFVNVVASDHIIGTYSDSVAGNTDWKKCEVVFDVPQDASVLNLNFQLNGAGEAWADDIRLEEVNTDITPSPNRLRKPFTDAEFQAKTAEGIKTHIAEVRAHGKVLFENLDFER